MTRKVASRMTVHIVPETDRELKATLFGIENELRRVVERMDDFLAIMHRFEALEAQDRLKSAGG